MPIPSKLYAYLHAGKPIVATAVGCHTEVLGEDTAILVEPDVGSFAEALVRLVGAPELRKQLGDSAVWYYRATYRPESYLAKLGRVYQCLPS